MKINKAKYKEENTVSILSAYHSNKDKQEHIREYLKIQMKYWEHLHLS